MNYIEAIADYTDAPRPWVFMAGGITGVPNWQQELRGLLDGCSDGTLINPRRADFPIGDPDAALQQITWEFNALWQADIFSMWFSHGSVQPICMYELGAHLARFKLGDTPLSKIIIGVDPAYVRNQDVLIQTELIRSSIANNPDPAIDMCSSLEAQADLIKKAVIDLT